MRHGALSRATLDFIASEMQTQASRLQRHAASLTVAAGAGRWIVVRPSKVMSKFQISCGACGSRKLRKLSMVVDEGTFHGVSTGPRYTVRHTHQSSLAARHAPRHGMSAVEGFVAAYCAIPFVLTFQAAGHVSLAVSQLGWLSNLLVRGLAGGLAALAFYALIRTVFPAVLERARQASRRAVDEAVDYQQTWLCMACGHQQIEE
jgi:hypothetical protein